MFDSYLCKSVDANGDTVFESVSSFVYDGLDVVAVLDGAGSVTNRYLHGPGIDQVFADERLGGEVLWALSDNLGSVRDWVQRDDQTGVTSVVEHLEYDAYGNILSHTNGSGQTVTNDAFFAFTGREWDADADLYFYRARWYDPGVGRFISEDPLGFGAGDVNVQRYVGNHPNLATDPSGLAEKNDIDQMTEANGSSMQGLYDYFLQNPEVYDEFVERYGTPAVNRLQQLEDWGWTVSGKSMWTATSIDTTSRNVWYDTTLGTMSGGTPTQKQTVDWIYLAIMDPAIMAPKHDTGDQLNAGGINHWGQKQTNAFDQVKATNCQMYYDVRNGVFIEIATRGSLKVLGAMLEARRAAKATANSIDNVCAPNSSDRARLFAKTTETGSPSMPPGAGRTDKFGNVTYSTLGSAEDVALARFHESVHSILSPKLNVLRELRADIGITAYQKSSLLRYVEEALAETYAQIRVNGFKGIPTGIRFPVKEGYVTVRAVVTEAAIGTVVVGGVTYGVYRASAE